MDYGNLIERAKISIKKLEKIGIFLDISERNTIIKATKVLSSALRISKAKFIPGHDIEHVFRVMELAICLYKKYGGDFETIVVASLLHDIMRIEKNHAEKSAKFAINFLRNTSFAQKATKIADVIREHSYSVASKASSIESQILQDADRLDALGAIGIARVFAYSAHKERPLYNLPSLKNKETSLGHFYDKILKLPMLMNTELAKKIAEKRVKIIKNFIDIIISEIFLEDIQV